MWGIGCWVGGVGIVCYIGLEDEPLTNMGESRFNSIKVSIFTHLSVDFVNMVLSTMRYSC